MSGARERINKILRKRNQEEKNERDSWRRRKEKEKERRLRNLKESKRLMQEMGTLELLGGLNSEYLAGEGEINVSSHDFEEWVRNSDRGGLGPSQRVDEQYSLATLSWEKDDPKYSKSYQRVLTVKIKIRNNISDPHIEIRKDEDRYDSEGKKTRMHDGYPAEYITRSDKYREEDWYELARDTVAETFVDLEGLR